MRILNTLAVWIVVLAIFAVPVALAQETDAAEPETSPDALVFPRTLQGESGTLVVHAPQIDSWERFERIQGRLAVEVTPAGEDEPSPTSGYCRQGDFPSQHR